MFGLFGNARPDADHTRRVKEWVCSIAGPPAGAHIMVTQVACQDADCPDLETVIAILEQGVPARRYKIFKAVAEITETDVLAAIKLGDAARQNSSLEHLK